MDKDTIYRQAAIDALVEEKGIINGILDSFMLGNEARKKWEQIRERLLDDIEIIAELPSAQPEHNYCRECKWSRCHINADKYGNTETYWRCIYWCGETDEEGFCYNWERRTDETDRCE